MARAFAALACLLLASLAPAADKRPIQVDDLFRFKRVADPQISPDGKWVAYQLTTVNLDANKSSTAIWVASTTGHPAPRPVTHSGKRDAHPRWSPGGNLLLFESNRSGTPQLYILDLKSGGEARQVTSISTGAGNGIWSPDGSHVAFVSAVYPEFSDKPYAESDKLNKQKQDEVENSPVKARVFTKLFFRHWDEYVEGKRQHLFVKKVGYSTIESPAADPPDWDKLPPRDVTPGDRDAYPTSSTFSSGEDFTFTPDSKHLVFTAVPEKAEAWSTNYDLCRVSITNTSPKWETLTKDNPAADGGPRFSPDGKWLAYRAQKKAGYEADKWELVAYESNPDGTLKGKRRLMTGHTPDAVNEFAWVPGTDALVYTADSAGRTAVYHAEPTKEAGPKILFPAGRTANSLSVGGRAVVFAAAGMDRPPAVWRWSFDEGGALHEVADPNAELLAELDRPKPESVSVPVEGGVTMQMWVLKPPGFDAAKKWPVVYLIHGGPQGAWEDGWSYRWNPQVWAAKGYVVVMPNPRGSTGFGQKFVDEISGDWGGKCYRDLVAGLDAVEKLPYVDKDRIGSAGASFGGYMQNWFAVNDIATRFKCLITHCSVWNFESMWGTTEELWFDEYEHGGLPWEVPGKYREFSPHIKAANLGKFKTPMLVIHNDNDFRCPIGQGHELFSALQRQGVPSRMVNFPDEGHWVLKPKNSQYWNKEVFDWLTKYVPPGGK